MANGSWWLLGPGLIAVVAVSAWLSVIDVREHRLPNRIVGPLAGGVFIWLAVLGIATDQLDRMASAVGWGFAGFAVFFALHLIAGLGMGDVKYAWPVCATLGWFGWASLRVALFGLVISGGLAGALAMKSGKGRDHKVAYGPFMAFGLLCGITKGVLGS